MDWVESKKFREAQNCPARALFNFIQDLSTSDTSSAKIADTFAPTALVLGGIPQCWDLQTPRDKVTSNSSNLWSSISSPTSLKKKVWEVSNFPLSHTYRETEQATLIMLSYTHITFSKERMKSSTTLRPTHSGTILILWSEMRVLWPTISNPKSPTTLSSFWLQTDISWIYKWGIKHFLFWSRGLKVMRP